MLVGTIPKEVDTVRGLERGADDYVVKTLFDAELMARVRIAAAPRALRSSGGRSAMRALSA